MAVPKRKVKLNYLFVDQVKYGQQHPNSEMHSEHQSKFSLKFSLHHKEEDLPKNVNLAPLVNEVYDQGEIGSCVSNAVAMAYRMTIAAYNEKTTFHKYAFGYKNIDPSRLFTYYYTRLLEGVSPHQDCGTSILSGFRSIVEKGVVSEKYWPYDTRKYSTPPPGNIVRLAENNVTPGYQKIKNTLYHLKHALANKQPVAFGAVLYKDFFKKRISSKGGVVRVPERKHQDIQGGHALLIVGYDDEEKVFLVKNSWGPEWGNSGLCKFEYDYITDGELCADFWAFARI